MRHSLFLILNASFPLSYLSFAPFMAANNNDTALLQVQQLGKQAKEGMVSVQDISFEQQRLQKMAIAGETGCGKTTLLKMIGGYVQPSSGTILFEQRRVKGPDEQLIAGHKSIAYLSQHFESTLR